VGGSRGEALGAVALLPLLRGLAERERPATAEVQPAQVEDDVGNTEDGEQDQSGGHNYLYARVAETDVPGGFQSRRPLKALDSPVRAQPGTGGDLDVVAQLLRLAQMLELLQ
jgi:hypothetical protein